jgi:hypothetical protein
MKTARIVLAIIALVSIAVAGASVYATSDTAACPSCEACP